MNRSLRLNKVAGDFVVPYRSCVGGDESHEIQTTAKAMALLIDLVRRDGGVCFTARMCAYPLRRSTHSS